jgi:hypothetical protein
MRLIAFLHVVALLSLTKEVHAQRRFHSTTDSIPPRHYFAFRVESGVLVEKPVTTLTGNYQLQSKPQGSFSGGFIYQLNMSRRWNTSYGLLLNIVSANYYLHIPDSDLKGFPSTGGAPQILDKQVYYRASVPVFLTYNFKFSNKGFYGLHAGGKLHYSGGGTDMSLGVVMYDSSRRPNNLFKGHFTYNDGVWFSYTAGVSKTVLLENGGLLSFDLFGELSGANFIHGDYQVTVPNQPVTTGDYKIKGSCVGLSLQYYFRKRRR